MTSTGTVKRRGCWLVSPRSRPARWPPQVARAASAKADLAAIRARIAALEARLAESAKNVATLSRGDPAPRLEARDRPQESKLLAARRDGAHADARGDAGRAGGGRGVGPHVPRRARLAGARAAAASGGSDTSACSSRRGTRRGFLRALERLDELARRDGRLLAAHRVAQRRLEADLAREEAHQDGARCELDGEPPRARGDGEPAERAARPSWRASGERRRPGATRSTRSRTRPTRLERLLDTLAQQSSGETADAAGGIRPWKGVLDWPAKGAMVETFGRHRHPKFDAWTVSNGVALARRRRERPSAPSTRARRSTRSGSRSTATSSSSTTATASSRSTPGCSPCRSPRAPSSRRARRRHGGNGPGARRSPVSISRCATARRRAIPVAWLR